MTIDTLDNSPGPSIDDGQGVDSTSLQPYPSPARDDLAAGNDLIYGDGPFSAAGLEGDFTDIIFGDHGAVIQDVEDPHLPPARLQKIQTTSVESVLTVIGREFTNGGNDTIFGGLDLDIIMGGAGDDVIDAGRLQKCPGYRIR